MKKIIILLLSILITCIIITVLITKKGLLNICFFSVEKSDSILITYKDKVILIDTSLDTYKDKIIDYLNKKNIKTIDYLILTHFDKDHIGGASEIINNFDVKNIYQNNYTKESEYYTNYINSLNKKNIKPNIIEQKYTFEIEDLKFIIYPAYKVYENDTSNNSSLVISLNYKSNNFLFMGDIENDRIKDFINEIDKNYDLIKLPHHGKYNKELKNLFNKIKTKYAVITNNTIDNKTSDLLNKNNIKYYITTKNIYVNSNGNNININ